jgi:hypothetical protein
LRKYYQGKFIPKNKNKYIGDINNIFYRSYWELKFMQYCDLNENIIEYGSEEIVIPYFDTTTKKTRRYFPDFFIVVKEANNIIRRYIIEIKPSRQIQQPKEPKRRTKNWLYESVQYERNICKWNAAKIFCEKNGFEFKIITERELNIKY